MGSNPSKRVGSADQVTNHRTSLKTQSDPVQDFVVPSDECQTSNSESKKDLASLSLSELKTQNKDLEEQLNSANKQMTELECQNLELQDYIQTLEQQIEFDQKEKEQKTGQDDFTETLKVKQQYIEKLEKEIENINGETTKLRIKFKKRLRTIKAKYAESKNEGSMDVLEMNDEITKLREENRSLKKDTGSENVFRTTNAPNIEEDSESGRFKIILDLSARVSEQDAKLTELENKLTEKDKHIKRLENELHQNSKADDYRDHEKSVSPSFQNEFVDTGSNRLDSVKMPDKGDVNWYTNKTFEQLSSSHAMTQNHSKLTPDENTEDLKTIAAEINKLKIKKRKSGKKLYSHEGPNLSNKGSNAIVKSRNSSGISTDSGTSTMFQNQKVITANREHLNSANSRTSEASCESVTSHNFEDKPLRSNNKEIGDFEGDMNTDYSDNETVSQNDSQRTTPIDPSNIRQISALGAKTKRKKGYFTRNHINKGYFASEDNNSQSVITTNSKMDTRPPIHTNKPRLVEIEDANMLINSIDEDLLCYSKSIVPQTVPAISS